MSPVRPAEHEDRRARVDLHVHSSASNVTDYYATNALAIPECYSDPVQTYHLLKSRGMQLVTISDHNAIGGVLQLLDAGLPDVFISAEMTASFPEDRCRIHVTVANVTVAQFAEVDRLRHNVYEMVAYLDAEIAAETSAGPGEPSRNTLAYFMTHPLMSTQNRPYGREGSLSLRHIEKALLLFNCLEVQNGARSRALNGITQRLLDSLTPQTIERLANTHGLEPKGETPWLKTVVGGSDDHSGINPGRTWTEFPYEGETPTANDFVRAVRRRQTRPGGAHGGPVTLAHAIVKLFYDGQFKAPQQSRPLSMGDPINLLLRFAFDAEGAAFHRTIVPRLRLWFQAVVASRVGDVLELDKSFERILIEEEHALLADRAFRQTLAATERTDDKIFLIISTLLNRIFAAYVSRLRGTSSGDILKTIKEAVSLVSSNLFVSLPYFICYSHMSSDRYLTNDVRRAFDLSEPDRLVLLTDTLFDINGVARTIRQMLREAERRHIDLTVVTCLSREEQGQHLADPEVRALVERGRLKIFTSIANFDLPEYDDLQLRVLPFLEFLQYAQEQGFTKMQISTPGPIGLLGLLAAKILQIETASTYHTNLPEYVEAYTGDVSLEALTWKYLVLFYHSVDEVVVPSRFIARLLHQRGLRNRKLLVLDRWVDPAQFHPAKRTPGYWARFGLAQEDALVKFVYVGRVATEKNLDTLAAAYLALRRQDRRAHLIVVGDGPYRQTLTRLLGEAPVTFTGFLEGEDLARAIASADVKVFPSATDTWGNAPLEAQASGLPVIVSDKGGPQELIEDGVTGLKVGGGDVQSLLAAMLRLMDDGTRQEMGRCARVHVEMHAVTDPYTAILDARLHRQRMREARAAEAAEQETATDRRSADRADAEQPDLPDYVPFGVHLGA